MSGKADYRKWRVVVYSDALLFGGHEITLLEAVRGLAVNECDRVEVILMLAGNNRRFLEKIKSFKLNIQIVTLPFSTSPGDVFRVIFRTAKVREISREMEKLQPDLIVVSQGAIALSACGLGAAKLTGVPVVSFLPMAQTVAVTRGRRSVDIFFQELLYRRLYTIPDYYFTICMSTKKQLYELYNIDREKIYVSYYGLDTLKLPVPKSRKRLNKNVKHLGLIGRVEFNQKQQDFFVRELVKYKNDIGRVIVHIIGDGPDLDNLKNIVQNLGIDSLVSFDGWSDDMQRWYEKLDLVLLPSRFEGFPIVMIEAMYWGVPVVASNVDGMREVLDEKWLFPANDGKEMFRKIKYVLENDQSKLVMENHHYVQEKLNIHAFREGFCNCVMQCLTAQ
jgi:glycosyltransferase involved in cell wall biosynthesis